MTDKSLVIRGLDEDLHFKFKLACIQDRTSMHDKMVQLIKRYLNEKESEGRK